MMRNKKTFVNLPFIAFLVGILLLFYGVYSLDIDFVPLLPC